MTYQHFAETSTLELSALCILYGVNVRCVRKNK